MRWASFIGFVVASVGLIYGLVIVIKTFIFGEAVHSFPTLFSSITFLGSIQFLTTGILGQYVGHAYIESKNRPLYLVKDVLQGDTGMTNATNGQGSQKAAR